MKEELCKHGHVLCPHCAIIKERTKNIDYRIQKIKYQESVDKTFKKYH